MSLEWLFPKTRWVILKSLFSHPEQEFYVSQLIRLAGGSSAHVQRELRQFTREGLLTRTKAGNQVRYRANPDHPLFPDLRSLVLKTAGLVDVLRRALKDLSGVRAAFVYGSLAKGDLRADSDVDIMIIGSVKFSEALEALNPAREAINRELNPTVLAPAEFRRRLSSEDHFLTQVVRGPKLFVVGVEDDIKRVGSPK